RPECNLVERHPVAAHGGLRLRGADDIVPCILVEPGTGFANEFVEILEFFAAGAELDVPRRPYGGPVVHGASLPFCRHITRRQTGKATALNELGVMQTQGCYSFARCIKLGPRGSRSEERRVGKECR